MLMYFLDWFWLVVHLTLSFWTSEFCFLGYMFEWLVVARVLLLLLLECCSFSSCCVGYINRSLVVFFGIHYHYWVLLWCCWNWFQMGCWCQWITSLLVDIKDWVTGCCYVISHWFLMGCWCQWVITIVYLWNVFLLNDLLKNICIHKNWQ